ncbi:RNA polymerase sigma factor [Sphingorhabdus sp. Alg239-R122]|uniref:RNA polymerase sigma factor n=1 Tax=Sphingorhabdus sp. Alg239-R122 TaxID=2305989 RepID=UPI0013D94271|nr:RNA polymerase sigma factor [Sphingorhabdus sp. Alg239-R122]
MNNIAHDYEQMNDRQLVEAAVQKDSTAIALITRRNNQRLFRAAWSILRNHADAEEVVQDSYLKAFRALDKFEGKSSLSTWLTRIALNTALDRKRSNDRKIDAFRAQDVTVIDAYRSTYSSSSEASELPSSILARSELSKFLKAAVRRLPDPYRTVFILRDIEGMSVAETAKAMEIPASTIKTRLFRARRLMRKDIEVEFGNVFDDTITFAGADCEAMTAKIIKEFCPNKTENENDN